MAPTDPPASAARCVPLCAAGDHVAWWHHEWPCPVRQEHEAMKQEYERLLTIGHPSNPHEVAPDAD